MRVDYDMVAGKAYQADLYYRHNFGIGIYFDNFISIKFGSEPESVEMSKKNYGGCSNLDYMNLKMDH